MVKRQSFAYAELLIEIASQGQNIPQGTIQNAQKKILLLNLS